MRRLAVFFSLILTLGLNAQNVRPGIDLFLEREIADYAGKRLGIITNATGLTSDLRSTVDVLHAVRTLKVTALFAPEHGIRGDITAGGFVSDYKDPATGIPVYSLYGKNRRPSRAMLEDVDVLVYDIQDIGNRTYTYISMMGLALESAAENAIPLQEAKKADYS